METDQQIRERFDNSVGRLWYQVRGGVTRLSDHCTSMVHPRDEVFLYGILDDRNDDLRFLRGAIETIPEFDPPYETFLPFRKHPDKPNTYTFPEYQYTGASYRIKLFAQFSRWYDYRHRGVLRDVNRYLRSLKVDMFDTAQLFQDVSTQYLFDVLFAIVRANRFADGSIDGHAVALAKVANEIRRRVLLRNSDHEKMPRLIFAPPPIVDPRLIRFSIPDKTSTETLRYVIDGFWIIYIEGYEGQWRNPLDIEEFRREIRQQYASLEALEADLSDIIRRYNLKWTD